MADLSSAFQSMFDAAHGGGVASSAPKASVLAPAFQKMLDGASSASVPPSAAPTSSGPDMLHEATGAAARNFTFGLSDQAEALGGATSYELKKMFGANVPQKSFGQAYRNSLASIRGENQTFAKTHPVLNTLSAGAGLAGSIGPFSGMRAAPSLMGKIAQGVKVGLPVGAAGGVAGADLSNPQDVAQKGAVGGVAGGALGAALPVAGSLVGTALSPIGERLGLTNPASKAMREVSDRIRQDALGGGPSVSDIAMGLGRTPGNSIADLGGDNLRNLGGSIYRAGGPAAQTIKKTLETRDAQAGTILSDAIDQGIARGPSNFATSAALQEQASKTAGPLYEQAFAANKNVASPELDRILKTPLGQSALSDVAATMQNGRTLMGLPDAELGQQAREAGQFIPGGRGVASGLKLQAWDQIKQAMDARVGALRRQVINGNATGFQLRNAVKLRNELVSELDRLDVTGRAGPNSLKPQGGLYAQARKAFAGPAAMDDALEEGAKIFSKHPDEIAADITGLSPSERDSYLLGAANSLKDRIAKTANSADEAKKVVGNEMLRNQLRPLFASQQGYDRFINTANDVSKQFATKYDVLGGSQTASRQAADMQGNHAALGDIVRGATALAEGAPVASTLSLARAAGRGLQGMIGRRSPATNQAVAKLLYSADPRIQQSLLLSLMKRQVPIAGMATAPAVSLLGGTMRNLAAPYVP